MQLALYKGPPAGVLNKLAHWAICLRTFSRYSHAELQIDGVCWTSSYRDGGVRGKRIDLSDGHWDVFPVQGDQAAAIAWFHAHEGRPYDWPGIVRFVLPFVRQRRGAFFCSEAVAAALGMPHPDKTSPQALKPAAVAPVLS